MEVKKFVSVIIPSKRKALLKSCLASLEKQTYPADMFEIIVISPEKYVEKHSSSIVIKNIIDKKANQAEARNIAEKLANGEILAFCDDDCILPPKWIETGARHFSVREIATVGGPSKPALENVPFRELLSGLLMISFLGTGSHRKAYTAASETKPRLCMPVEIICANMFVDRSKFREVGGFNRIVPQEEDRLNTKFIKKGYWIVYDPDCFNIHYQRPYGYQFIRNIFWLMVGQGSLAMSRFSPSSIYYLIPSIFVVSLIIGPFLFFVPYIKFLYILFLIIYAFSMFIESWRLVFRLKIQKRLKILTFLLMPFVLLIHHIVAGIGFILGSFRQLLHRIRLKSGGKGDYD